MKKYSRERERVLKAFDRDYFDRLFTEADGDIARASKLSGLEIEHLRERTRDVGIKWPKREEIRRLTDREVKEIERRLSEKETPSSIAIRIGVGKSRILYQKKLIERRRREK